MSELKPANEHPDFGKVCIHGSLKRQCYTCELEVSNDWLKKVNQNLRDEIDRLKAENQRLKDGQPNDLLEIEMAHSERLEKDIKTLREEIVRKGEAFKWFWKHGYLFSHHSYCDSFGKDFGSLHENDDCQCGLFQALRNLKEALNLTDGQQEKK